MAMFVAQRTTIKIHLIHRRINAMLTQPIVEQLHSLRCTGMAEALREQLQTPGAASLSFEERLAFLIDAPSGATCHIR